MSGCVWYRVKVSSSGIESVDRVEARGTDGSQVYFVLASSKEEASVSGKAAFNAYCAAKKRQRMKRLAEEGRCRCGRDRDGETKLCSVCRERQRYLRSSPVKNEAARKPRDEKARVAGRLARQRDRRKEIRLETLLEVRAKYTRKGFQEWLAREIQKAVSPTLVDVSSERKAS